MTVLYHFICNARHEMKWYAWKRYSFQAEPPCLGHYREYSHPQAQHKIMTVVLFTTRIWLCSRLCVCVRYLSVKVQTSRRVLKKQTIIDIVELVQASLVLPLLFNGRLTLFRLGFIDLTMTRGWEGGDSAHLPFMTSSTLKLHWSNDDEFLKSLYQ